MFLVAVAVPREDTVYYQEIDFVLTHDALVTVRKTPPDERAVRPAAGEGGLPPGEPPGMTLFRLVDEIAEAYLDLVDS